MMPVAIAAAKAGKHIICEKPLAMNAEESRSMLDAAREADIRHMTAFNYRRVPAVMLAKQIIDQGKIGRIYHFNAVYYQDWLVDPTFPYVWRHDKKVGGSGAHGDMNAHIIDFARYLVGEIEAVCCDQEVFIKERKMSDGSVGEVTADDAAYIMSKFLSAQPSQHQQQLLKLCAHSSVRYCILCSRVQSRWFTSPVNPVVGQPENAPAKNRRER